MSLHNITCMDIFLTSSGPELLEEQLELGNYIRTLNDTLLEKGVYFRFHICRSVCREMARIQKQDQENRVMHSSHYCFVLCGQQADENMVREFDEVLQQFRSTGSPKIMTFFRASEKPEKSVREFMEHLSRDIQHYYTEFIHIDTVKMKILMALSRDVDAMHTVDLRDGRLYLGNQALDSIDLAHIPCYAMHSVIQGITEELRRLKGQEDELRKKLDKTPGSASLNRKLRELQSKKAQAEERLHDTEHALLDTAAKLVPGEDGSAVTERLQEAMILFDRGQVEEAIRCMDNDARRQDASYARSLLAQAKRQLSALCQEALSKISMISSQGVTEESALEILALYREVKGYIEDGDLDRRPLLAYSQFLLRQMRTDEAVSEIRELYDHLKQEPLRDPALLAEAAGWLAGFLMHRETSSETMAQAQVYYHEAQEIYQRLSQTDPHTYALPLASICANLAAVQTQTGQPEEAIEKLREIRLRLLRLREESGSITERNDLTEGLVFLDGNLADALENSGRSPEAEPFSAEAEAFARRLSTDDPDNPCYETLLINALLGVSACARRVEKWELAAETAVEAADIARNLCRSNPSAYRYELKDAADSLNRLVALHIDNMDLDHAEPLLQQTTRLYRYLNETDPRENHLTLGYALNHLAQIYDHRGRVKDARPLYEESLSCFSPEEQQDILPLIAHSLRQIGYGYEGEGRLMKALQYLTAAREAFSRLEEENPGSCRSELDKLDDQLSQLGDVRLKKPVHKKKKK